MEEISMRRTVGGSGRRRSGAARALSLVAAFGLAACGGDGPVDPNPPPPPPSPPPAPAVSLNLSLGDLQRLTDPQEIRAFELVGDDGQREYEVIVQSASETFGSSTQMQLSVGAGAASATRVRTDVPRLATSPRWLPRMMELRRRSFEAEATIRAATRAEIARVGATPIRRPSAGMSGPRLSVTGADVPAVGDPVTFSLGVISATSVSCSNPTTIDGTVKFVGQHFIIVEDDQITAGFTDPQYDQIGQFLDDVVYPVDTDYFGTPADLDDNDRVIALITAEVNKLTPANSNTFIAGFFWSGDLLPKSQCQASNEAEILYLIAPDPNGDFGDDVATDDARELVRTTTSHEFLHLINSERRLVLGNANEAEDTWLDEGLAHLAEELVGFASVDLATRNNFDLADVASNQSQLDAFNEFHRLNIFRFADFMLDPNGTPALGDATGGDPQGESSLEMRGFAYAFVRWLGDRFGPAGPPGVLPGSGEQVLFRRLSVGGPNFLAGTENVVDAVQAIAGESVAWDELLSLFLASLLLDDRAPAGTDPRTQWLTWNLEDLFGQLNQTNLGSTPQFAKPFPLEPREITLSATTSETQNFRVNASTGRFFRLIGGSTTPDVTLELTTQTGADLPTDVPLQVTIVRVR